MFATCGQPPPPPRKKKTNSRKPPKKKHQKKTNNSTDYVGPRGSHRAMVSRLVVFFAFWFLTVFATCGQRPNKPRESPKKNKKQNSTDYVGLRGSHMAIVSRVFGFLQGFATFGQKPPPPKKKKESRKQKKLHRLCGAKG